ATKESKRISPKSTFSKASTSTSSPGAMSARLLGYVAMGVASIVAAVFFN
ncbi:hypothetical protein F443_11219, partial [Phytophthora nicotianae P1569]